MKRTVILALHLFMLQTMAMNNAQIIEEYDSSAQPVPGIADQEQKKTFPLHIAVWNDEIGKVEQLLKQDHQVDEQNDEHKTPLHMAAQKGDNPDIIRLLLARGAQKESVCKFGGMRAIHFAVFNNNVAVLQELLAQGVNKEAQTHFGLRPLHIAILQGHPESVRMLLVSGANQHSRVGTLEKNDEFDYKEIREARKMIQYCHMLPLEIAEKRLDKKLMKKPKANRSSKSWIVPLEQREAVLRVVEGFELLLQLRQVRFFIALKRLPYGLPRELCLLIARKLTL